MKREVKEVGDEAARQRTVAEAFAKRAAPKKPVKAKATKAKK